ncbi:MAG: hypothetical protein ABSG84_06495 [Acidobacteriaceae bacterium]|jgi:hypothetical protein
MKSGSAFVYFPQLIAGFLVLSVFTTQTTFAAAPQTPAPGQASANVLAPTITVPAGTVVPLTLVSQVKSKSTKVGDTVRAVVAFPITVGTQVAIPAGTYVEGVVTSLTAQAKTTHQPDVQIHFTRLLYANGYTATLDAINTQASNQTPAAPSPVLLSEVAAPAAAGAGRTHVAFYGGEGFTSHAQVTEPTLPPLPTTGRNIFIAVSSAMVGAFVIFMIVVLHHKNNSDYLLFDAGWQFQIALSSPLSLDAGQVAAAANTPSH